MAAGLGSGSVAESLLVGFNEMGYEIYHCLLGFRFVVPFMVGMGELIPFGDDA